MNNSKLNQVELSKKVATLVLLSHGLRRGTIATFNIYLITMSNGACIFYSSKLLKDNRQRETKR